MVSYWATLRDGLYAWHLQQATAIVLLLLTFRYAMVAATRDTRLRANNWPGLIIAT